MALGRAGSAGSTEAIVVLVVVLVVVVVSGNVFRTRDVDVGRLCVVDGGEEVDVVGAAVVVGATVVVVA